MTSRTSGQSTLPNMCQQSSTSAAHYPQTLLHMSTVSQKTPHDNITDNTCQLSAKCTKQTPLHVKLLSFNQCATVCFLDQDTASILTCLMSWTQSRRAGRTCGTICVVSTNMRMNTKQNASLEIMNLLQSQKIGYKAHLPAIHSRHPVQRANTYCGVSNHRPHNATGCLMV